MLEAIILMAWRKLSPASILGLLLPGVCLLFALRAAMAGAPWPWVPAALAAALVFHLIDVRRRARGA